MSKSKFFEKENLEFSRDQIVVKHATNPEITFKKVGLDYVVISQNSQSICIYRDQLTSLGFALQEIGGMIADEESQSVDTNRSVNIDLLVAGKLEFDGEKKPFDPNEEKQPYESDEESPIVTESGEKYDEATDSELENNTPDSSDNIAGSIVEDKDAIGMGESNTALLNELPKTDELQEENNEESSDAPNESSSKSFAKKVGQKLGLI